MPIRNWDMDELQTNIKEAFDTANSVFQDGRLDNLAYKHKQLYALFGKHTRAMPAVAQLYADIFYFTRVP
jgi:hypothetical protein